MINKVEVDTPSEDYREMLLDWHLPETLMGGQRAMFEAGRLYLPQEPAESDELYLVRLNRSILYNVFGNTVKALTGRVFSKPISLSDDTSPRIFEYNENIDLRGNDLNSFYKDIFEDAMVHGLSYVLVDFPRVEDGISLADEMSLGLRPYCIHIKATQLIKAVPEYINGRTELKRVHIVEEVSEEDGWGENIVRQVRVLYKGGWEIYRQSEKNGWVVVDRGITNLDFIPLAVFYANKKDFMKGISPLQDLAYLNLGHWQSDSDQRNILHVARVPILFGAGLDPEQIGDMEIGANRLIIGPENAKLSFTEHTGSAIGSGKDDIASLESRMAILAMDPSLGTGTATGDALDTSKSNSALQDMALRLQTTIEIVNGYMAIWDGLGVEAGGSVVVNRDFGLLKRDGSESGILLKARQNKSISLPTFWKELKKRGLLSDDFDPVAEEAKIKTEAEENMQQNNYQNETGKQVVGDDNAEDLDFGQQRME